MNPNSFYADFYGEYYRFKEEDVLDDFTLSDNVPDFVKRLFDKGIITAGFGRIGIGATKVLGYTWEEDTLNETVLPGDCLIQLSYMERLNDDEIHIIPRRVFNSLFHFSEEGEQHEQA